MCLKQNKKKLIFFMTKEKDDIIPLFHTSISVYTFTSSPGVFCILISSLFLIIDK